VIVGDGPLRGELEALSVELVVRDRVILTGWLEEPRALFGTFDVLAQASRYESFPLALLEAMHAGTPIVATSVGGVPEMLEHGRTGLVVPPEHPDALAAALERLLGDPELRRRLGVHAREVAVARFGTDVMCRAYEALYGEIAGG
jgi:glycosyltransferase involved in cell wall biosynthesis